MSSIITVLGTANTILAFAAGFIASYNLNKFVDEWTEDHAKSEGFTRRMRLSTIAIFSTSLSDRCSRRRRQVLLRASAFFVLVGVQLLITFVLRSLR
jgi:hypothetical protein